MLTPTDRTPSTRRPDDVTADGFRSAARCTDSKTIRNVRLPIQTTSLNSRRIWFLEGMRLAIDRQRMTSMWRLLDHRATRTPPTKISRQESFDIEGRPRCWLRPAISTATHNVYRVNWDALETVSSRPMCLYSSDTFSRGPYHVYGNFGDKFPTPLPVAEVDPFCETF